MPNMTIKDIARLSGCSVSTISRVINDRPDVRPETKEKVLQMMRDCWIFSCRALVFGTKPDSRII